MIQNKLLLVLLICMCICILIDSITIKRKEESKIEKIQKSEARINTDFEKVQRVIKSCRTSEQLASAGNMIKGFKKKHKMNRSVKEFSEILYNQLEQKRSEL